MNPTHEQDRERKIPIAEMMSQARRSWAKAQVVRQEPSFEGQPESCYIMERLVHDYPECEPELVKLVGDENPLVVAHALLTLEMLGSNTLCNLSSDLLAKKGKITIVVGSLRNSMDLGGLARQIQKRAQERVIRRSEKSSQDSPPLSDPPS